MSHFHNMSTVQIADEFGDVKAQIAALEEREKVLKEELVRRSTGVPLTGQKWTVTISEVTSKRLDTKGLRELLGDALAPYEKSSTAITARVKPTVVFGERAA